jgi:hypothetical protein
MTPKEKAQELVNKYKYHVSGYVGSSMLTNHEYPEQILANAKKCALITVAEIESELTRYGQSSHELQNMEYEWRYWDAVKQLIETL